MLLVASPSSWTPSSAAARASWSFVAVTPSHESSRLERPTASTSRRFFDPTRLTGGGRPSSESFAPLSPSRTGPGPADTRHDHPRESRALAGKIGRGDRRRGRRGHRSDHCGRVAGWGRALRRQEQAAATRIRRGRLHDDPNRAIRPRCRQDTCLAACAHSTLGAPSRRPRSLDRGHGSNSQPDGCLGRSLGIRGPTRTRPPAVRVVPSVCVPQRCGRNQTCRKPRRPRGGRSAGAGVARALHYRRGATDHPTRAP